MGRGEKRELAGRLKVLLAHLLKWRHQPGNRGNSWRLTIEEQRRAQQDGGCGGIDERGGLDGTGEAVEGCDGGGAGGLPAGHRGAAGVAIGGAANGVGPENAFDPGVPRGGVTISGLACPSLGTGYMRVSRGRPAGVLRRRGGRWARPFLRGVGLGR